MQFVSTMAPSYSSSSSGAPAATGWDIYFSTCVMFSSKFWIHVKSNLLTLNARLSSQEIPEFLRSMVVNAFLNELDVLSPTAQISLALDEISQLWCLNTITQKIKSWVVIKNTKIHRWDWYTWVQHKYKSPMLLPCEHLSCCLYFITHPLKTA